MRLHKDVTFMVGQFRGLSKCVRNVASTTFRLLSQRTKSTHVRAFSWHIKIVDVFGPFALDRYFGVVFVARGIKIRTGPYVML